jgi:hypothetical protein
MISKSITQQVFLSHARNDKSLANALTKELRRRGFKVWNDQSILPGGDWSDEITKALQESDSMIALLNQHSYSSSYVRYELEHVFFDDRYKNRLLPVLIGSSSDEGFVRLPWVLTKLPFLKLSEKLSMDEMAKRITEEFIALLKGRGANNDT